MEFVVESRIAPGVVQLLMRQPGKKNAMNAAMREELGRRVDAIAADASVDALVLAGADGDFSAGGDIQGLMRVDRSEFRAYLARGHELVRKLWRLEKPTVAAIEGVGVGGGLALAMCCDHVVIGRSARIGFTFLRIGFVPDWGTLFTVTRRVGPARARSLFLEARLVGAAEAAALGLVDEVVEDGEVAATVLGAAQRLAGQPKRAYALTKRFLQQLPATLDETLEFELMAQDTCFKSDDFLRGVQPYLDPKPDS
jgi:enoyl-CoA hydratase/carnithine racemase